jgi:hypothetical protein
LAAAAVVFAVGVDPEVGFLGVFKVGGWSVLGATAGLVRIRSTKERVMSVRHRRLAVAGVIAVTAIAVPAAALASGAGSPSGKPAPSSAASKSAGPSELPAVAASAGISVSRLQAGLVAVKQAGGNSAAGVAAFAASTGVSTATAQRIVDAVFGTPVDRSLTGPAAVSMLATRLGVSTGAAERALQQIGALSRQGGVDSTGPAFAAIAHDLGVSPARLAAAMDGLKQSMAGK